jgi:hypothetical protein
MTEPKSPEAQNEALLRAYNLAFNTAWGKEVVADLAAYCRASESCVVKNARGEIDAAATMLLEGRREVFLRIQQFAKLTEDEILQLRMERIRSMPQPETQD